MFWYTSAIVILFIAIVAAEEPQQQQFNRPPSSAVSGTTGFTVGKQYNLDAKVLKDGTASGSVYALLGGQVGPGPSYYPANNGHEGPSGPLRDAPTGNYYPPQQYSRDPEGLSQGPYASSASSSSLWSPSNVNYYVAGGVFAVVLVGYGLYCFLTTPSAFKRIAAQVTGDDEEEEEAGVVGVVPESKKDTKVASKKTRRRRAIRRNEEAARLASIVLSAIESGECLQNSICLMGSQIGGTEKGKLALTVLGKLVPIYMQDNHYFTTLQDALQDGESTCARFNCKF